MSPSALDALLALIHHLLAFGLASALAAELVVSDAIPDGRRLQQLVELDLAVGLCAAGVAVAGGLRVLLGVKGLSHYAHTPWFWAKGLAFVACGLLWVVPSRQLRRWHRQVVLPDATALYDMRQWVKVQLALLALVIVLSVPMARAAVS